MTFASKTLTPTQSAYSNIEREALAIVYGIHKFHTYLFGKPFVVVTDHKPLLMILNKPLKSAPPRLQRLLIKIQDYDFLLVHRPGSQMIIADALSRLPNSKKSAEIPLDIAVDNILIDDIDEYQQIDLINVSISKRIQLRGLSAIKELPQYLRPYWSYRDEIGISGLMRDSVYWPNIHKDIETLIKSCETCQESQTEQKKQPMIAHEVPSTPWTKVASDMFEMKGDHYLLITDYHSKFPYVKKVQSTSSATIAHLTAECVSLFGPPMEIVTTNGPQCVGKPYNDVCSKWSIKHTTTSPRYDQSKGLVKRQVRTVKGIIQKCSKTT